MRLAAGVLVEALFYASRGWRVVPLTPPSARGAGAGKRPCIKKWVTAASTCERQIKQWWEEFPNANVGIATGKQSDLVVVDVDQKSGGLESYDTLKAQYDWPATVEVETGGGGLHIYFRYPGSGTVPDVPDGKGLPGIEIKADGRQVVAPPSIHAGSGQPYEFEVSSDPRDGVEVAPLPDWLWGLIRQWATPTAPARPSKAEPEFIEEGGRDNYLFKVASRLRGVGLDEDEILVKLKRVNAEKCRPPVNEADLPRISRSAGRFEPNQLLADARPIIYLRQGELSETMHAAALALKDSHSQVYNRGGALYRPVRMVTGICSGGVTRAQDSLTLVPVDSEWVRYRLAQVAEWQRWDKTAIDWKVCDPSKDVCAGVAGIPDVFGWSPLRGIARVPVLLASGRRAGNGYDPETQLLVDAPGDWPDLPTNPTKKDAEKALATLAELLRYMPVVSDVDAAVAFSLLITAIMRPVMMNAPGHAIDATAPGSGKSLLVAVASLLATGTRAAVADYGRDPIEASKRLDGMLLAGDPIIALDNVESDLEGATLCQTITEPSRRIRPLGSSEQITVPCTALICATGNNLIVKGDLIRRMLVCRLDAKVERPELRSIDQDLIEEATTRRRELVTACQTVVLAYLRAKPRLKLQQIGSFDDWTALVRGPIVWAGNGLPDPATAMERLRLEDPVAQAGTTIYHAWHQCVGSQPMTVAGLIELTDNDIDLRHGLELVASQRDMISPHRLRHWLRTNRDRIYSGLRLVRHDRDTGAAKGHRYYIEEV